MQHYQMFDREFFYKHQQKILRLLNSPVVGKKFRHILGLDTGSFVGNNYIKKIEPNAIWWDNRVEIRTHCKFSKRLYYAFKPLWWTMHYWDELFADRYIPQWSFGFETLTYYPAPKQYFGSGQDGTTSQGVDGTVSRAPSPSELWGTIRSGAGTNFNSTATGSNFINIITGTNAQGVNRFTELMRGIFNFDTSLLGGSRIINSGTLQLYCTSKGDGLGWLPDIDIYQVSTASNSAIVAADYGTFGSTSYTGSPVAYNDLVVSSFNTWTLNATGIAAVNQTGVTKLGTRNANYDVANLSPTPWSQLNGTSIGFYTANRSGLAQCPILTLDLVPDVQPPNAPVLTSATGGINKNTITWTWSA